MDTTNIIRTNPQDAAFLELVRLLDIDLAERDGEEHAFYAQFNATDALTHCLVILKNNQAVSCGALKQIDNQTAEVKRMYTLPAHRGQGLATSVLDALEKWAKEDGMNRLILETGKKQPEAVSLYADYGFKRIPNYGQYIGISNSICFELIFGTIH